MFARERKEELLAYMRVHKRAGIHELGLVVDLHPQRLQGLAPVSGAEEGLGHVQVKEVDGLAAQFRQCLGEIEGQLAFAAARLAQENNIAAGSHIQKTGY